MDCHACGEKLGCVICGADAQMPEVRDLRAELAESDQLRERMAQLLTDTAAALKGPPPPLTMHDWVRVAP